MLKALKDEISKKKRSLEESKIFTNERKYFKRAELDRIMYGQSSSETADSVKKNDDKKFNETNNISKCEDVDEGPTLPRTEVRNL